MRRGGRKQSGHLRLVADIADLARQGRAAGQRCVQGGGVEVTDIDLGASGHKGVGHCQANARCGGGNQYALMQMA